jgi:hypothetical protein
VICDVEDLLHLRRRSVVVDEFFRHLSLNQVRAEIRNQEHGNSALKGWGMKERLGTYPAPPKLAGEGLISCAEVGVLDKRLNALHELSRRGKMTAGCGMKSGAIRIHIAGHKGQQSTGNGRAPGQILSV